MSELRVLTSEEVDKAEKSSNAFLEEGYYDPDDFEPRAIFTIRDREQRIGQLWEAYGIMTLSLEAATGIARDLLASADADRRRIAAQAERIADLEAAIFRTARCIENDQAISSASVLAMLLPLLPQPEEGGDDDEG